MNGYDNQAQQMHPFLVAMGPDIKVTEGIQKMEQIDLYPLICAMLGLDKPNKIDGNINNITHLLKTPPSEAYIKQFESYAHGKK